MDIGWIYKIIKCEQWLESFVYYTEDITLGIKSRTKEKILKIKKELNVFNCYETRI